MIVIDDKIASFWKEGNMPGSGNLFENVKGGKISKAIRSQCCIDGESIISNPHEPFICTKIVCVYHLLSVFDVLRLSIFVSFCSFINLCHMGHVFEPNEKVKFQRAHFGFIQILQPNKFGN